MIVLKLTALGSRIFEIEIGAADHAGLCHFGHGSFTEQAGEVSSKLLELDAVMLSDVIIIKRFYTDCSCQKEEIYGSRTRKPTHQQA